jgi:hypothetical protein
MAATRSSKRVAGLGVDEELPTKRPTRSKAPSQKVMDSAKPPTGTRKRSAKAQNKAKPNPQEAPEPDTPSRVLLPQDQPPFIPGGAAPRSSPPTNSTPPTNLPKGPTRIEFDPTQEQIAHQQLVSIQLEWFVDDKRQSTVLETQDINDVLRFGSSWADLKKLILEEVDY